MEKLSELINSLTEKTNLVIGKMNELKAENMCLQTENADLKEKLATLLASSESTSKVINIAQKNYASAPTESIKKTIDGIVSEIDQALAILSN